MWYSLCNSLTNAFASWRSLIRFQVEFSNAGEKRNMNCSCGVGLFVCSSLVQGNSFGWCPCCCLPFCGLLLCKFMVAIMQHYRKTGPLQRCFVFCHRTVPIYLLQTFTVNRLTSPICWRFLKCGIIGQIAKNWQFSCGNKLAQELGWIMENRAIAVLKQLMKLKKLGSMMQNGDQLQVGLTKELTLKLPSIVRATSWKEREFRSILHLSWLFIKVS